MDKKSTKIEVTDDDLKLLAEGEAKTGQPWRQLFREAVAKHVKPFSARLDMGTASLYDRMLRIGGIGIIEDGPTDLSTNKKYMRGFGESRGE